MALRARRKRYTGQSAPPGYMGLGIIENVRQEVSELERIFGRQLFGGRASVSVGPGVIPFLISRDWISPTPPATATDPASYPAPPIDRRDLPSNQAELPLMDPSLMGTGALSDAAWLEMMGMGPPATLQPAVAPAPTVPLQQPQENDVGVLSDIYDMVDTSVGGVLPGGVPFGTVPVTGGIPAHMAAPTVQSVPTQTVGTASPTSSPGPDYQYIHTCKKGWHWAKKRRRRRKRLATASDIRDIASLMGAFNVKGAQTQAFNTYIATHS